MLGFTLSKLEKKRMQRDFDHLLKQGELAIAHYQDAEWTPGNDSTTSGWSNFKEYYAMPNRIDETNIRRFPYGNIERGDLVVFIPKDTKLDKESSKYKIKYNGKTYTTHTGLSESDQISDDYFHYILVGKL